MGQNIFTGSSTINGDVSAAPNVQVLGVGQRLVRGRITSAIGYNTLYTCPAGKKCTIFGFGASYGTAQVFTWAFNDGVSSGDVNSWSYKTSTANPEYQHISPVPVMVLAAGEMFKCQSSVGSAALTYWGVEEDV